MKSANRPRDPSEQPISAVDGRLRDYISGEMVRATPEEANAVQVLARRLVEDYGYLPEQLRTRPQFRVRRRPSDESRGYPVDIAVFRGGQHSEDELFIIAECKKPNRTEGIEQLKLYLDMSRATIGIWFNGEDHMYLHKVSKDDGTRTFEVLPNVPRADQRIADIGKFTRRELAKPSNLKAVFRDLRNHLAGHVTGITRDEGLAQEIVNLLFCKIYDEVNTGQDDIVTFRCGHNEPASDVLQRIGDLFECVKGEYDDVFSPMDVITLDAESVSYVVGELQNYSVTEADRDAVGEAFEVFIGPALRGAEGQFFTPRNVVKMLIEMVDPKPGERVIDPACGSGGFLIMALEHVWRQVEAEASGKGWTDVQLDRKKRDVASRAFRGFDKDAFLARVTKAYMAIIGDGRGGVFCENSLLPPSRWQQQAQRVVELGSFDVVLANPPFGSKIRIKGPETLAQFDLGHKWKRDRNAQEMVRLTDLREDQAPQLLFLERCLQLLRPGGRLGIVLPESILGNPSYEYVIVWLMRRAQIRAVVTMPEPLFKTSGKSGTHTKVCVMVVENAPPTEQRDFDIFMADAKWCGHDSRGNPTVRVTQGVPELLDDVPVIANRYRAAGAEVDHLGFRTRRADLVGSILVPKYYDPELKERLARLALSHDLIRLGDLVSEGTISIATGVEVGKMAYGTGQVPFIRTSDISNWELKADPKQGVSQALYEELRGKAEAQPGDILMVRDGTYLIGTCALLTEFDGDLLFQSHIYRLRVEDSVRLHPALLFACLNTPVVKRQIKAKQFTQDIIDTLGARVTELLLPLPRGQKERERLAALTQETVETRAALRNRAAEIALEVEGVEELSEEDRELLETL